MKLAARIVLPILAALLLAGGTLGYAWWQLQESSATIRQKLLESLKMQEQKTGGPPVPGDDLTDAGDVVLIHLRQGDLLGLQGDWAAAEKEYRTAVDAGAGAPALRKLAQAQLQRREITEVRRTLQELRRSGARAEDVLLLETIVHLRTGELVKAQDLLAEAQDSPQKHYGLALLSIIQNRHEDVQKEIQAVLNGWDPTLRSYARTLLSAYNEYALFPESRPIHLTTLLARALAQVQECELALPLLAQVLAEQSDYRDAWTVQGYCELTTERGPEALESFEKAYAIDPEKPEIQYFLGRTYMALRQWKNAATFLQYALINGFDPQKEVRKRLAEAAMEADDAPLAYQQFSALLGEPDADLPLFERTVAVAIRLEKKEDAYQIAQSAVKKWPADAAAHELVGWTAAETDRNEEARAELEKALQLDPNRESAKERLGRLSTP